MVMNFAPWVDMMLLIKTLTVSRSAVGCENIQSWISLIGDLAFCHQHGIYGFKFPSGFLEISSRNLTTLTALII
jgi:hypothetical protein